jgi:hypothetical protein
MKGAKATLCVWLAHDVAFFWIYRAVALFQMPALTALSALTALALIARREEGGLLRLILRTINWRDINRLLLAITHNCHWHTL